MLAVQEVVIHQIDEELAAARVRPGVGHGNGVAVVLVLAGELVLDGVARAPAARSRRVPALNHEV